MFPSPGLRLPSHGLYGREHLLARQAHDRHPSVLSLQPGGHLETFLDEHEHFRRNSDILAERFVAECPEIFPRCRFNPLREEEVREVYYVAIRELSRSSLRSSEIDITRIWLRRLERLIEVDRADARMSNEVFVHRRSNHLFRALAEVSYANRSLRIGQILHSFFLRHASQIVSTETSATIGQWCNAVLRAHMTETQRNECFRHVHRLRPDLPQSLRRYGRRGQLVAEHMERLSVEYTAEMRGFGFERPTLGYRPRSADSLAGNGGLLGPRSHSFNGRHGLISGGLLNDDLHELNEMDHANRYGLRSDRYLLQDDFEEQQLLDLSMGPRYNARLDDMRSLEEMGLLTLGDGVEDMFGRLSSHAALHFDDDFDMYGI
ncbi:hypothetical protein Slin15195_G025310 [Septoria linicola]|uniref:Uncharacterized protein n=1 Tax=Septoria linicola TaxID=215465 RepID=A0A9Q9ANF6_9PEZI|nr:hypothetical protein Slin14017_G024390 [Septoria linicola]USW49212.1 hypothetical protein Slin15195_G025310 [Septoria linicola]